MRPLAMHQQQQSRTVPQTLVEYKCAMVDAGKSSDTTSDIRRSWACSAQDALHEIVWDKEENTSYLLSNISPMRDEWLSSDASIFYGGKHERYKPIISYSTMLGSSEVCIHGTCVLHVSNCNTFGALVLTCKDKESNVVILAPQAPLACIETSFLNYGCELTKFEQHMAASECGTVEASHKTVAQFVRQAGAGNFPFDTFKVAHYLKINGPLPALCAAGPQNNADVILMQKALEDFRIGNGDLEIVEAEDCIFARLDDFLQAENRYVSMTTFFCSSAGTDNNTSTSASYKQSPSTASAATAILHRPVVSELAACLCLRSGKEDTEHASPTFEVRLEQVLPKHDKLNEKIQVALKTSILFAKNKEYGIRRNFVENFLPDSSLLPTTSHCTHVQSLNELLTTTQTRTQSLTTVGNNDVHAKLAPYFERRGVFEILTLKATFPIKNYMKTVASMLSCRHAIGLLVSNGQYAVNLHVHTNQSCHQLKVEHVHRLNMSTWCVVFLIDEKDKIYVLNTQGVVKEKLQLRNNLEMSDASIGVAPLVRESVKIMNDLKTTLQRVETELHTQILDNSTFKKRSLDMREETTRIKRLRQNLNYLRNAGRKSFLKIES